MPWVVAQRPRGTAGRGSGRDVPPGPPLCPCASRAPAGAPPSQPWWDGSRALPSPAGMQSPERRPRDLGAGGGGLWDSRDLSGSRGPLRGRLPAPRALRVGASHSSERGAPAAPACAPPRAGPTRTPAGGGGGRRRKGGAAGGRGCRGARPQGPGRRESRLKGVAGDAATSPPIAGLGRRGGPGPPPGDPAGRG